MPECKDAYGYAAHCDTCKQATQHTVITGLDMGRFSKEAKPGGLCGRSQSLAAGRILIEKGVSEGKVSRAEVRKHP
jgi:hypothetical protein